MRWEDSPLGKIPFNAADGLQGASHQRKLFHTPAFPNFVRKHT